MATKMCVGTATTYDVQVVQQWFGETATMMSNSYSSSMQGVVANICQCYSSDVQVLRRCARAATMMCKGYNNGLLGPLL